jgi:hypothetical protein
MTQRQLVVTFALIEAVCIGFALALHTLQGAHP